MTAHSPKPKARRQERQPCPVEGCQQTRAPAQLVCSTHWYSIPPRERAEVWKLYREQPGSEAHRRACVHAVLLAARPTDWPMPQRCRSCGAAIYWMRTTQARKMPVDAETAIAAGRDPRDHPFDAKCHGSHFATCPNANQHRTQ